MQQQLSDESHGFQEDLRMKTRLRESRSDRHKTNCMRSYYIVQARIAPFPPLIESNLNHCDNEPITSKLFISSSSSDCFLMISNNLETCFPSFGGLPRSWTSAPSIPKFCASALYLKEHTIRNSSRNLKRLSDFGFHAGYASFS